jgi:hypothetical protein
VQARGVLGRLKSIWNSYDSRTHFNRRGSYTSLNGLRPFAMFYRTFVLLVAAAVLGVVALAFQTGAASAGTTTSTFVHHEASAQFVSDARGLHTSVDIVVEESERATDAGVERSMNASIEIFQSDLRRPKAQPVDLSGSVEGEPGALHMNSDLSEASVELTIPVCGAKVLHSGRLKARPFSECFDATVDLRWTGTGELAIFNGQSDSTVGDCTLHTAAISKRRTASAEGSVLAGGANLAPAVTNSTMLSEFNETSTTTCPEKTLAELIAAGDRAGIKDWAAPKTIAEINAEVAALDAAQRDQLAAVVLDTNADATSRDLLLRTMRAVLAKPDLGFYAEIWSYTFIEMVEGGFFGTCQHLLLSPTAWSGLSDHDARWVLLHESFHSFNCVNGGPIGSLNEGSAIWIAKSSFPEGTDPAETWAEATFGTKLFYRDFNGQPDFPLEAPPAPSGKLIEVYQRLSQLDPSQLPWNSTERLTTCFNRYWAGLNRNVDFYAVWLPSVAQATAAMLTDPECRPV